MRRRPSAAQLCAIGLPPPRFIEAAAPRLLADLRPASEGQASGC